MDFLIELFISLACASLYLIAGVFLGIDIEKVKGYKAAKRIIQQDDDFTKALKRMMEKAGDFIDEDN